MMRGWLGAGVMCHVCVMCVCVCVCHVCVCWGGSRGRGRGRWVLLCSGGECDEG
jgi:hypothetical protein